MRTPRSLVALVSAGRLYSRPLRRQFRASGAGRCYSPRLGPTTKRGHEVVLRAPRLSDAAAWRAIRLRDRQFIEPFWLSSPQPWADRHTESAWAEEVLSAYRDARAGRAVSLVIEVDGRFAGQLKLERVDCGARSAEVGVWLDSTFAGRGVVRAAGRMVAEHGFDTMGLRRITAAVCVNNLPALLAVKQFGMRREGTMASYLDVGGRRREHDLWAITSEMWTARAATTVP